MKDSVTANACKIAIQNNDEVTIPSNTYTASIARAVDRTVLLGERLTVIDIADEYTVYVKRNDSRKIFKAAKTTCEYFPDLTSHGTKYNKVEIWDNNREKTIYGDYEPKLSDTGRYHYNIKEYGGQVSFDKNGQNSFPYGYAIIRGM